MKITWRRHQQWPALACPLSLKETTCESFNFFFFKFSTWQDECDEAGGDGHGAKDEGGDDGADLGQGGHCG